MTPARALHLVDLLRQRVGDNHADDLLEALDVGELPVGLATLCRRLDDEEVPLDDEVSSALVDLCRRQRVDEVEWAHLRPGSAGER